MRFRKTIQADQVQLQLAPMIDIVFLLLIFFIVTWSFARFETQLDISVPAASEGEDRPRATQEIIVNVNESGAIIVNNAELTEEQLFAKAVTISSVNPDVAIILRGDINTDYRNIIRVLDVCRRAGIWNVAFATARPDA